MLPRKRAIPSDFDPVYPYESPSLILSGSFINPYKGLTNSPPGFIAIKAKPPLSFDNEGNLIVAGSGAQVDPDKGLSKEDDKISVKISEPLTFNSNGEIALGPVVSLRQNATDFPIVSFNNQDDTRLGYVGLGGSTSVHLNSVNDIFLRAGLSNIVSTNVPIIYVGQKPCTMGCGVKFYETTAGKNCFLGTLGGEYTLMFRDPTENVATKNRISTLDLESKTKIINVPDPQAITDVVNMRAIQKLGVAGTLWTGPHAVLNAQPESASGSDKTLYLSLSLTAVAGTVIGTVSIKGLKDPYLYLPLTTGESRIRIKLLFDNDGNLMSSSNLDTYSWGTRYGNKLVVGNPNKINLRAFMPNRNLYTQGRSNNSQYIFANCFLSFDKSVPLAISMNTDYNYYSLYFTFDRLNDQSLNSYRLETSTFMFTYLNDYYGNDGT